MLRKNRKLLTICMSLCICVFSAVFGMCLIGNPSQVYVYAEEMQEPSGEEIPEGGGTEDETVEDEIDYDQVFADGFKLTEADITDANLRNCLLNIFKSKTDYRSIDALYSTMFNLPVFTSITLDNKNISSLKGLELLEFEYLESMSINYNAINSFSSTYLAGVTDKFTSLSLKNNAITNIKLDNLNRLTYVDVSSNQISSIDLSHVVVAESGTDVYVNLAGNQFTTMNKILLPERRVGKITLNLIGNNIADIESKYFDGNKYITSVGVQALKDGKFNTATTIDFYRIGDENVAIEIWRIDGDEDVLVDTITDEDISECGFVLTKKYPIGEYYFNYTVNGGAVPSKSYYNDGTFNIIPQTPNITYTYKNQTTKTLGKVTGKVTVNLSTEEEGAKIYYQLNGKDWVEGNTIQCEDGGSYSVKVKAAVVTENGEVVESEIKEVLVRTSLNLYISDGVMLVIVALIALTLFLVVVPLISRKYFKRD